MWFWIIVALAVFWFLGRDEKKNNRKKRPINHKPVIAADKNSNAWMTMRSRAEQLGRQASDYAWKHQDDESKADKIILKYNSFITQSEEAAKLAPLPFEKEPPFIDYEPMFRALAMIDDNETANDFIQRLSKLKVPGLKEDWKQAKKTVQQEREEIAARKKWVSDAPEKIELYKKEKQHVPLMKLAKELSSEDSLPEFKVAINGLKEIGKTSEDKIVILEAVLARLEGDYEVAKGALIKASHIAKEAGAKTRIKAVEVEARNLYRTLDANDPTFEAVRLLSEK